jgi:hypothetical protein
MSWKSAARGSAAAVSAGLALSVLAAAGWAQERPAAPIHRLDDPTRARALAALAALIILGFAMVLLTWLGARVAHRYRKGSAYFRPTRRPSEHDWARKPLVSPESDSESRAAPDRDA